MGHNERDEKGCKMDVDGRRPSTEVDQVERAGWSTLTEKRYVASTSTVDPQR